MPINYDSYPKNWFSEIRPAVLKRANDCCEECGLKNHIIIERRENLPPRIVGVDEIMRIGNLASESGIGMQSTLKQAGLTMVVLTIAHLDNDKSNHEVKLDRLKALCQKCHLFLDKNHHAENRKYGRDHKENNFKLDL